MVNQTLLNQDPAVSISDSDLMYLVSDPSGTPKDNKLTFELLKGTILGTNLEALKSYNTDGLITQTAAGIFAGRTIAGTSNKITVTNGNGVSGNPTITIPSTLYQQNIRAETSAGLDLLNNSGASVLQLGAGGGVELTAGGQINSTSGINFGGSTLANYEEGTFTPVLYGTTVAGTPTYTVQAGRYTRIGNRCFAHGNVIWSSLGGATGNMRVSGLPFTCKSGSANRGFVDNFYYHSLGIVTAGACGLAAFVEHNQTFIILLERGQNSTSTTLTDVTATPTGEIYFTAIYEIN